MPDTGKISSQTNHSHLPFFVITMINIFTLVSRKLVFVSITLLLLSIKELHTFHVQNYQQQQTFSHLPYVLFLKIQVFGIKHHVEIHFYIVNMGFTNSLSSALKLKLWILQLKPPQKC